MDNFQVAFKIYYLYLRFDWTSCDVHDKIGRTLQNILKKWGERMWNVFTCPKMESNGGINAPKTALYTNSICWKKVLCWRRIQYILFIRLLIFEFYKRWRIYWRAKRRLDSEDGLFFMKIKTSAAPFCEGSFLLFYIIRFQFYLTLNFTAFIVTLVINSWQNIEFYCFSSA